MPFSLTYHCKQPHHSSMISLSSALALKGHLKPSSSTTTVLLIVFILTLHINSCEARHLRAHGNKDYPSKLTSCSTPKQGGASKGKTSSSPEVPVVESNMDASVGNEAVIAAEKEMASSGDSCRGSLRKRSEGTKVRSSSLRRERSVLGAESNSEQVGLNTTTAYTAAETLVAMDYLDAHPAPAVHNR